MVELSIILFVTWHANRGCGAILRCIRQLHVLASLALQYFFHLITDTSKNSERAICFHFIFLSGTLS